MRKVTGKSRRPIFVFDFGGVVIKWKSNNPIFDNVADAYGVPREKMRKVLLDDLPRLEAGDVSMRGYLEDALGRFGKTLRKGDSPEELWTEPFERLVKFRDGTLRVVESLRKKGFLVYLFSNTSMPHVEFLRRMKWHELFDGFISSCELRSVKPSKTAFTRALDSIGADPSEVVFIDDREENVAGAKASGISWAFRFTSIGQLKRDIAPLISEKRPSSRSAR